MKKILSVIFTVLLLQMQAWALVLPESIPIVVQPQQMIDADDYKLNDQVKFTVLSQSRLIMMSL